MQDADVSAKTRQQYDKKKKILYFKWAHNICA